MNDETEIAEKGYRFGTYVKIGVNFYEVHVYDIVRLQQDFKRELETAGFYDIEPNIILVREVTKKDIEFTVRELCKRGYFDRLKPIGDRDVHEYEIRGKFFFENFDRWKAAIKKELTIVKLDL
ncbi:MAG: hypothetical protein ACM3PP_10550 [Candidatus Saccharibacteria bacterium]